MTAELSEARENTTPGAEAGRPAGVWRLYGRLWSRVPRELGFLVLTMPIAVVSLTVLSVLFFPGIGLLLLVVGVLLIVAALFVARGFGEFELARLHFSGLPRIPLPLWKIPGASSGMWRVVFGPLITGRYWLYLLHGLVIGPVISFISWTITIGWVVSGIGGLTYWWWDGAFPGGGRELLVSRIATGALAWTSGMPFDPRVAEGVLRIVLGIAFIVTLPFVTRALTLMHHGTARAMLGAWPSEALQREVTDLSASRGAAILAEDQALRRLERDIHDGPQQRLIRLQMDLAGARRRLGDDPEAAMALIDEAAVHAKATLEELRALSRGLAPPILQDRGLIPALESLAARSTVPVEFTSEFAPEAPLPAEIERNVYFLAAELITNVGKHAAASAARLTLRHHIDGASGTAWLDLWVTDNGRGGARLEDQHGLVGLRDRVRGLRGQLEIDSPAGGPTSIRASVPIPS